MSFHPAIGRFLECDPIEYTDGLNLYEYVNGNPVSYVDPLGLAKIKISGEVWDLHLTNEHPTFVSPEQARQLGINVPQNLREIDLGPHLHDGETGRKFFPRNGVIRNRDGSLERANNKFMKNWSNIESSKQYRRALARAGISGLLLLIGFAVNECTGENAKIAERIKDNLKKLTLSKPYPEKELAAAIIINDVGNLFGNDIAKNVLMERLLHAIDNPQTRDEAEREFDKVEID